MQTALLLKSLEHGFLYWMVLEFAWWIKNVIKDCKSTLFKPQKIKVRNAYPCNFVIVTLNFSTKKQSITTQEPMSLRIKSKPLEKINLV